MILKLKRKMNKYKLSEISYSLVHKQMSSVSLALFFCSFVFLWNLAKSKNFFRRKKFLAIQLIFSRFLAKKTPKTLEK